MEALCIEEKQATEESLNLNEADVSAAIEDCLMSSIEGGAPSAEYSMTHLFSPGVYWREIEMKAGTYLIGREHTTRHFNVVLTGKCEVLIEGEMHVIDATKGPIIFESEAGVRKTLRIIEDMRWATIHPNPANLQDIDILEDIFSVKSQREIQHENFMTIKGGRE